MTTRPRHLTTGLAFALFIAGFTAAPAHAQALGQAPAPPLLLADAQKMIDAAQKAAADLNLRLSIAVVDGRGDLIAVSRMPGAGAATPDTAIGKAMLSTLMGRPSAAMVGMANTPFVQAYNDATGGRLRFLQGAVPIVRNGVVIGAIAGSGATSQQDEDAANVGLKALP